MVIRIRPWLIVAALIFLLRLPFLNQAIQGDDPYYLYGAEHAQIDTLHPTHAKYLFQGDLVDMRGHPHGPLNSWILGAALAAVGDVREPLFHFRYILWSLIAAMAMWSLARRFCDRPWWAVLLFLTVPAFVVNGNSLEADLPFLAMWMLTVAFFVRAVDEDSRAALCGAAIAGALAGLAAYQAILLTPVLTFYLFEKRRNSSPMWAVAFAAPLAIGIWQLYELATGGVLPAAMLAGYMHSYGLQAGSNKLRSAAALIVHSGWIVCPLVVLFLKGPKWRWAAAASAAAGGAVYDHNPLFWFSLGCGVFLLTSCIGRGFLGAWVLIFFAGAAIVFFAGSARYLLPIAAPVAILAARDCRPGVLAAGFALQMALSLGLAIVNYQHWGAYRQFAASLSKSTGNRRIWIDAEWGLRFYLESDGALPLGKNQALQPGDVVVSSALALPVAVTAPLVPLVETEIRPSIPLRLISLEHRSAYSSAASGLLPFEISNGPIDRVSAGIVVERKPELTSIDPADPKAAAQIISGLYPDRWMTDQATVLLKRPEHATPLRVLLYIPLTAPARNLKMLVDGQLAAEETFARPGEFTVAIPGSDGGGQVTVTLIVDKTYTAPGDLRKLGALILKLGFW